MKLTTLSNWEIEEEVQIENQNKVEIPKEIRQHCGEKVTQEDKIRFCEVLERTATSKKLVEQIETQWDSREKKPNKYQSEGNVSHSIIRLI